MAAYEVVTFRGIFQPGAREGCAASARHAMLLHEVLEKAPAAFLVFRDFLLQCRRQNAYLAYCEGSRDRNSQGEPFDAAVKFPREKECGLQCRVREIMLFDWSENRPETHGDIQFERLLCAPCAHSRARLRTSRRFTRDPWESDRAPRLSIVQAARVSSIANSPIT
jgi:hypothetical protein